MVTTIGEIKQKQKLKKMGKDFILINENGFNLKDIYNKLFSGCYEILEASEEKFFYRIPLLKEVKNIEVGIDGLSLDSENTEIYNRLVKIKEEFN